MSEPFFLFNVEANDDGSYTLTAAHSGTIPSGEYELVPLGLVARLREALEEIARGGCP